MKYREAKYWTSSKFVRYCCIFSGRTCSSVRMEPYSLASTVPSRSAKYSPTKSSAASWVEYPLLVATAISGPAQVYSTSSASRAMELPTTLQMARVLPPKRFASRSAAIVSSVSPDWLIVITRVF